MVTKCVKQPNGKYMSVQTTAHMLSWNMEKPWTEVNYDTWEEFCESVEYNQGFTRKILEKLIEEMPEEGIAEMSNFDYADHYNYMHHDFPENPTYDPAKCDQCKYFEKRQAILFPEEES